MTNDIASELAKLKVLKGSDFVGQLKLIAARKEFHPFYNNPEIYFVGGEQDADFPYLLNAARKATEHGFRVFILPNPRDFRSADFILERRGVFKLFDLKTISGQNIVECRLLESIGQSNRVLLNMATGYNTRLLAANIRSYFESSREALEVLIFKGKDEISIYRRLAMSARFYAEFRKIYEK